MIYFCSELSEVRVQYDTEHCFAELYKTQLSEMTEEFEEKLADISKLNSEKNDYLQEIDYLKTKFNNEIVAHTSSQDKISQLENEKMKFELSVMESEKRIAVLKKETELIDTLRRSESEQSRTVDHLKKENTELNVKISLLNQELENFKSTDYKKEIEVLANKYKQEKMLKEQAVNKLAEIMNRRDINPNVKKSKGTSVELKKKEKECRKLQQDLTNERDLCNMKLSRQQKEITDLHAQLLDESNAKRRLKMELDAKDCEIEQLRQKLSDIARMNSDENLGNTSSASIHSDLSLSSTASHETRLEGWLSIPNKQNIRRYGWRKQYVVVSSRKIIFYNSENDKVKSDPTLILDLR